MRELCRRADIILAVTPGKRALAAVRSARRHLRPGHIYVDSSAAPFRDALSPYGMNAQVIEGPPGAASAMKLIRSVFMKGITGLLLESMEAAERCGIRGALEADISRLGLHERFGGAVPETIAPVIEALVGKA